MTVTRPAVAGLTAFCLPKSKAAGDREYLKQRSIAILSTVMAGLVPAIHDLLAE
jgi:hypothetical protein